MKRFFFIFLVFFILFAGFFVFFRNDLFSRPDEHSESNVPEVSYIGTVKSLGTFAVPAAGTHFLEEQTGQTILLVGLGVNLDTYVGKKVSVRGRMGKTPSGKDLLQVLSVDEVSDISMAFVPKTSTEQTGHSSLDTSWTAFQNNAFGVSFQRRTHWKMDIKSAQITFELPPASLPLCPNAPCPVLKDDFITIARMQNGKKLSLQEFFASRSMVPTSSKVGVDSLPALKYVYDDTGVVEFALARDQHVYLLSYTPSEKRFGDSHQNDFFQLLSTFRFVPFE